MKGCSAGTKAKGKVGGGGKEKEDEGRGHESNGGDGDVSERWWCWGAQEGGRRGLQGPIRETRSTLRGSC